MKSLEEKINFNIELTDEKYDERVHLIYLLEENLKRKDIKKINTLLEYSSGEHIFRTLMYQVLVEELSDKKQVKMFKECFLEIDGMFFIGKHSREKHNELLKKLL